MLQITDEARNKIAAAIEDAAEYALCGVRAQVYYDPADDDVWVSQLQQDETYTEPRYMCVYAVEPFTLDELYGDDKNLAEDSEDFRAWYLHDWRGDNNTNGLNPEAIIDEWLQQNSND